MKEEIYEPSFEEDLIKEVRKLPGAFAIAGGKRGAESRIKDMPLFDLDRVEKLINGSVDAHIHAGPDPFVTRVGDQVDLAIEACEAGLKAVLFKTHHVSTAATAPLVQNAVNRWADEHGRKRLDVFGGTVLNYCVGGLNPEAVIVSARLGGRVIWPPNTDSRHYHQMIGLPGGIDILDENGKVVPAMREILGLIKEADMVLAMSCLGVKEVFYLIDEAKKIGVKSKRLNVIHPNNYSSLMTAEQMKIAADKGAWIELTCDSFGPPINFSWDVFMEAYKTVGADRIIAATDVGIFRSWRPIAALRHFVTGMLTRGIPDSDVEKMIKTNPTELLY